MNPEIVAAIIGVGGAIFIALCGNVVAMVYFGGRVAARLDAHEGAIHDLNHTVGGVLQDVALLKGRAEIA